MMGSTEILKKKPRALAMYRAQLKNLLEHSLTHTHAHTHTHTHTHTSLSSFLLTQHTLNVWFEKRASALHFVCKVMWKYDI